jgi:hypothetical protein
MNDFFIVTKKENAFISSDTLSYYIKQTVGGIIKKNIGNEANKKQNSFFSLGKVKI